MAKKPAAAPVADKPVNLLAGLGKVATKKPTAKPKKDDRTTIVLTDPDMIGEIGDMIRLTVMSTEVNDLLKHRKVEGTSLLFRDWVERYWNEKKLPDNPRYIIRKPDSNITDMECIFQVKFRSDGIDVPNQADLPDGTTVEDSIIDALTSLVGLSAKKAATLANQENGEILVSIEYHFPASFNAMYNSEEPNLRSAATKVMAFLQTPGKGGRVTLDALTPEEMAEIIQPRQVVRLKEGFLERAFLYCDTEEQLMKLLRYTKVTLMISNPKFAEADKKSERINRMQDTLQEFLGAEGDAA